MRFSAVQVLVAATMLAGCSPAPPPENSAPATKTDGSDVAREEAKGAVRDTTTPPFTLRCTADYNLKSLKGENFTGYSSFKISIDASRSEAYMTDWQAQGSYNGPTRDMEDKISKVHSMTAEQILAGPISIDRRTGRMQSGPHIGTCAPIELVPIPSAQKF